MGFSRKKDPSRPGDREERLPREGWGRETSEGVETSEGWEGG